jgi:putative phosphoribosyl transferase
VVEIVENSELRDKIHVFDDRSHAGELLAELLKKYTGRTDVIVLAIPAGGVPVALQVSKKLGVPLDLAVTRKLHIPWNKEAGFGAVSWDGSVILNRPLVDSLGLSSEEINRCVEEEKQIIYSRMKKFRGTVPFPVLEGKVVIVVDDGLASGFSMLVTVKTLRNKARLVVVAVPTAPVSAINLLRPNVGQIVCLNIRSGSFFAVAEAYKEWYDLDDKDVIGLLENVL